MAVRLHVQATAELKAAMEHETKRLTELSRKIKEEHRLIRRLEEKAGVKSMDKWEVTTPTPHTPTHDHHVHGATGNCTRALTTHSDGNTRVSTTPSVLADTTSDSPMLAGDRRIP